LGNAHCRVPYDAIERDTGRESADSLPQKVVSFKDLNLSSTEGVRVVWADQECSRASVDTLISASWQAVPAAKACIDQATSRGDLRGQSSVLTSLYLAKSGKTEKQLIAQLR